MNTHAGVWISRSRRNRSTANEVSAFPSRFSVARKKNGEKETSNLHVELHACVCVCLALFADSSLSYLISYWFSGGLVVGSSNDGAGGGGGSKTKKRRITEENYYCVWPDGKKKLV